ncbi:MAG: hypothetical protein LBF62_02360 [Tannerellaceae bacterium]|nr:hypothetical protein [Tannerellaceae bacterium]
MSGLLYLSRAFKAGDRITVGMALLIKIDRHLMETVVLQEYSLVATDIAELACPNQLYQ